jgi:hypothetical protein
MTDTIFTPTRVLLWLLGVAPDPARPAPPPPPPPPPPPVVMSPFRLGLTYVRVLNEDGELADNSLTTNALGIDMAFPSSSYVRNHLGLANQWEKAGAYSARGFRIDLISLGYPIQLLNSQVRLDLEPILTVIRGEIMFVSGANNIFRMESGFGLELSATFRRWYLSVQPLAIDFRYLVYTNDQSHTGFARLFPLRIAIGHEF